MELLVKIPFNTTAQIVKMKLSLFFLSDDSAKCDVTGRDDTRTKYYNRPYASGYFGQNFNTSFEVSASKYG